GKPQAAFWGKCNVRLPGPDQGRHAWSCLAATIAPMQETTDPVSFVHLRVHSEFSVSDGIVRLPELVSRVAALQQPAVAVTDLANLFGLIRFYKAARG